MKFWNMGKDKDNSAEEPEMTALEKRLVEKAALEEDEDEAFGRVVVVTVGAEAAVVGGETASNATSVSRSSTSSLNCTSSARRVSNSSSLLSKSPQPAPTRASIDTSAIPAVRMCIGGSIPDVGTDDESPP